MSAAPIPSAVVGSPDNYRWPEALDAVAAAPDSHVVLHEDDDMRVLLVQVPANTKEPVHTHRWPSVMIVEQGGCNTLETYALADDDSLHLQSSVEVPIPEKKPFAFRLPAELPHSFENREAFDFRAIRVEFKKQ